MEKEVMQKRMGVTQVCFQMSGAVCNPGWYHVGQRSAKSMQRNIRKKIHLVWVFFFF